MRWRRLLPALGVLVIAAILAWPLRETVYQLVVLPLAYLGWLLYLLYLSLSQGVWWIVVLVIVLFFIGRSLLPEIKLRAKPLAYHKIERGSVEALVSALEKKDRGIYFKWLVANRLGKLAYQILLQREYGKPRSVFAPLTDPGWDATPEIQEYLEKGLRGSFAEYPGTVRNMFATPAKTPLDQDVRKVIEFLESKTESTNH
ncbi:MAG TPA: hypothetical protein VFR47_14050 [Anaerolineales bacterium]|nr:hypothetical protein [Anaerolineales bacterium]